MQNRSNRTLLFGGRGGAPADAGVGLNPSATEIEAMESDNQNGVDALRGSAGLMKDIAIHIERDVNDQNRMLDRMDKRFDNASSTIGQTLGKLNELANDRGARQLCSLVGAFFVGLVVLYYIVKR